GLTQIILAATDAGGNPGVRLQLQSDGKLAWLHRFPSGTSGGSNIITTGSYTDNAWHYLTASYSAGQMNLYVDGILVGSATASGSAPGLLNLTLGRLSATVAGSAFSGTLDELTIVPAAVDAAGVNLLMQTTYPIIGIDSDFKPFNLGAQSTIVVSGTAQVSPTALGSQHRFDQEVEAAIDLQQTISYPYTDTNASSL